MACATPSSELENAPELKRQFFDKGWCRVPFDPVLMDWVERTLPAARTAVAAPQNAQWLRCGGTWFAGVNVLPNDTAGAVAGGMPLAGHAVEFIRNELETPEIAWDLGQVSVCYPGYPKPMPSESEAAFRYRYRRDAAHLDGFTRVGPERRRFLREHHRFVLGIPMVESAPDASPFVVWEGSHHVVRNTVEALYATHDPEEWRDLDVTETYHALRRGIFDECRRVEVRANPGEAYLVHRFVLHGVAPWTEGVGAGAGADGRMIAYFRPVFSAPLDWLATR